MQYALTQVKQYIKWYFVFIHVLIEATPRDRYDPSYCKQFYNK